MSLTNLQLGNIANIYIVGNISFVQDFNFSTNHYEVYSPGGNHKYIVVEPDKLMNPVHG